MFIKSIVPAAIAGLALSAAISLPVSAAPLATHQQAAVVEITANPLATEVAQRRRHVRQWNRRVHGPRCLRRYGSCRHYYRGYYYASPWWLFPAPFIGGRIVIHGGSRYARHVRWCEDHYRSYRRRTNTWISYSGEVRQCISPYS